MPKQADTYGWTGHIKAVLRDKDGNVKETREAKNLVTNAGKLMLAKLLGNRGGTNYPTHMACGSGDRAKAVGDVALQRQLGNRVAAVVTLDGSTVKFSATFGAGVATGAISEVGLFNAANAGSLFARVTIDVINKGADDTFEYTWSVTPA